MKTYIPTIEPYIMDYNYKNNMMTLRKVMLNERNYIPSKYISYAYICLN